MMNLPTEDKIRHFVLLINQYEKKKMESIAQRLSTLRTEYGIRQIGQPNSYGARTFYCDNIMFRTFKAKTVTRTMSGLTFYKIVDNVKIHEDVLDLTHMDMNI